jgi:hypothetical protein
MSFEVLVEVHLVGEGSTAAFDGTDERADIEVYDSVVGLERVGLWVSKAMKRLDDDAYSLESLGTSRFLANVILPSLPSSNGP